MRYLLFLYLLVGVLSAAKKYDKKNWIGCEPNKLHMSVFKDNRCTIRNLKAKPLPDKAYVDLTSGRCQVMDRGRWSFKGKCDMRTDNKKVLQQIEVKYYRDDRCDRPDDVRNDDRVNGNRDKIEYGFYQCQKHPFIPGSYTMLEPVGSGGLIVLVLLCCCCCVCILIVCCCCSGKGGGGDTHIEIHEERHSKSSSSKSHHSSRSRSPPRSHHSSPPRSHHSSPPRSHHSSPPRSHHSSPREPSHHSEEAENYDYNEQNEGSYHSDRS